MICKEVRIHLEHERDNDGYMYATIALFGSSDEDACCGFARPIDSFRTVGRIAVDFERDDIRMWNPNTNGYLDVDDSYGPEIKAI